MSNRSVTKLAAAKIQRRGKNEAMDLTRLLDRPKIPGVAALRADDMSKPAPRPQHCNFERLTVIKNSQDGPMVALAVLFNPADVFLCYFPA